MNSFLVQVQSEGYSTIIQNRSYYNVHWKRKAGGYKSKMWESRNNIDHGKVKSGDRLLVYCGSQVPNRDHKGLLAFSVYVRSVGNDKTFELGEPQLFRNPLAYKAIQDHIEQGELDSIFSNCGKTGFNITELKPIAVEQILNVVEPNGVSRFC